MSVSERVARDAHVLVAPLELGSIPASVDLTGEVAADPDHVAKVPVRVAGRIVEVSFHEGQQIKAGDVLATIESSEVTRVHAELSTTSTRADAAHKRVERLVELVKLGTASAQDLESARADASVLDADVAAARQTLSSMGGGGGATARLQLRAPFAGVITKRDGVVGQPVDANHVIAEIVDLDHAVFLARLFENDLARVHEGALAEVTLDAYPEVRFPGKVLTIGRQVEPMARAVLARVTIDDRDAKLKIGLFGTVHVVIADPVTRPPGPVAPTAAVAQIDDHPVVFVETAAREFELRQVELGHASGGKVELVAGVKAGERVAVDGLFTLKSLALKATFGEDE
ncbi:MAG: efflux RND transporter periplasmic adaptor subunit [Proteobacteria bacterium]|nr:efflux RND transporter periplasmic adaptor subunit [Pseudomonadota bacterium]